MVHGAGFQQIELLSAVDDLHGGVLVDMVEPMDSEVFVLSLRASVSNWKQQGKKNVSIKLPIERVNLLEAAIKEGFRYQHAEPDYLTVVYGIPDAADSLPVHATHQVAVGAFVINSKKEVLLVKDTEGKFWGIGTWRFPTGIVNEGEDISAAAVKEVKEETGIDTEFIEVLAIRQTHESFFPKSDMLFICMLQPISQDIHKEIPDVEAAQWMPMEEYAAQPFVQEHELFSYIAKICLAKSEMDYAGFAPLSSTTASGEPCYLYCNSQGLNQLSRF